MGLGGHPSQVHQIVEELGVAAVEAAGKALGAMSPF
jgi:hypothetical protein